MSGHRPSKAPSLRVNFSWNLAGNVVYAACQWGVLIATAKLLDTEAVGALTLALAITGPIVVFTNLGLRPALATDVRGDFAFGDYFALRILGSGVALLVICGIAPLAGFGVETALVIVLIGAGKAIEAQSQMVYGLCQQVERMDHVAISLVLRGAGALVALVAVLVASERLAAGVLAQACVWAAVLVFYDLPVARRLAAGGDARDALRRIEATDGAADIAPRWRAAKLSALTRLVLPLGFVGLLGALYMNVPRYVVAGELGLEPLGYFGAMMYILLAGNYVIQALGQAAVSRLARHHAEGDPAAFVALLLRLAGVAVSIGGVALLAAVVAGPEILALLYTPEYARFADVFVLLMLAALIRFTASMLQYGLTAARRFRLHLLNQSVVTAAAILASFALIPAYGLVGAGYAVVVAASVYLGGIAAIDWRLVRRMRAPGFRPDRGQNP